MDTVNKIFKNYGFDRVTKIFETYSLLILLIKQLALSFFTTELPVPVVKQEDCLMVIESKAAAIHPAKEKMSNNEFFSFLPILSQLDSEEN